MSSVVLQTAYAFLHVKTIDPETRTITGVASTPEADRMGDVVESLGVTFKNPVPLLLYHQRDKPVGTVRFMQPTADGVAFEASLPIIPEPGTLRDRIEEAWQSIKARLLAAVSIGFVPLAEPSFNKDTGGFIYPQTEVLELSLVTIPANAGATISTIKSFDRAAPGATVNLPGVSGLSPSRAKAARPMTIPEQITQFENTRAAKAAAMSTLMQTAADANVTLDTEQTGEYDGLDAEVKSIDSHLVRLRALETANKAAAKPVAPVAPAEPSRHVVQVRSVLPQGMAFIRYVMANVFSKGDSMKALEYAKQWRGSSPEVELAIKAAVAPGTTAAAGWAAELAPLVPMQQDFLAYLRPATVIGRIAGFKQVPFNISIPTQTGGGTYGWVGQGAPKPVGKLTVGSATLGITKCAGIIVITEELARVSSPSAEEVIRRDMRDGIAYFLDTEFTDPTKAPVANVSPGSITNGVTPITSAGTTPGNARTDIGALLSAIAAANLPIAGAHVLLSETNLLALALSQTSVGSPAFPGITPEGGSGMGVTFVGSQALGSNVVALQPNAVLMADDGGLNIDVSREASVQMDSAPMNPADATVVMTSFWQNNLIGLRAERFINWKNVRTGAVQRTVATYGAGTMTLLAEGPTGRDTSPRSAI